MDWTRHFNINFSRKQHVAMLICTWVEQGADEDEDRREEETRPAQSETSPVKRKSVS